MQDLRNKRVALYARFSSAMQREASIADQLRRCREYVVSHGGVVDEGLVFSDAAMSGASLHRPGFERMMKLVESIPAGVNLIVTEDMSRISRDFADSAIIFRLLEYLRIPLIGVADGVDTSAKGAKLAFTMKSMFSDMYLDDLRDKTLRGLRGRALAGYSTGGLPLGYRSVQVKDAYDRIIGHRIEVDPETAPTVRRIFELYLEGRSLETITRLFNEERVPPARAKTRHRRKGWVSNTVRNILHNEAYIGVWNFGRRQWRKVPGTNCRRPCPGDPSEVIRREYPDRVIIDEATWTAAQNRLAEVRAVYVKSPDGKRKRGAVSGRQNSYPLSGILFCGECGAPMTIHGGTSANYYRCVDQKKRGTCSNKLSLREDVAKRRLLDTIEERYARPKAILHLRQLIAERLGELSRKGNAQLEERRERLKRTRDKVAALVHFITMGDQSDAVRKSLYDFEAQAKAEEAAIAGLLAQASKPIPLPSPEFALRKVVDFRKQVEEDPVQARENMRRFFEQGRLLLMPQPEGHYIAATNFSPLRFLDFRETPVRSPGLQSNLDHKPKGLWSRESCAGRI